MCSLIIIDWLVKIFKYCDDDCNDGISAHALYKCVCVFLHPVLAVCFPALALFSLVAVPLTLALFCSLVCFACFRQPSDLRKHRRKVNYSNHAWVCPLCCTFFSHFLSFFFWKIFLALYFLHIVVSKSSLHWRLFSLVYYKPLAFFPLKQHFMVSCTYGVIH